MYTVFELRTPNGGYLTVISDDKWAKLTNPQREGYLLRQDGFQTESEAMSYLREIAGQGVAVRRRK